MVADRLIPGCSQKSIFLSGEWFSKALKSVGRVSHAILWSVKRTPRKYFATD
jgi:hypothetical protein